ncbi:MAG: cupin domain-containing protein [Candidatus Omnitrophica bacterium]|jgi:quercetin dioxygenase-like cupin family protein|nr:cupin domain-containing protein [Candidatus Omnitrophota bacterium]
MNTQDNITGTTLNVKDFVSYQKGSVVSRTLITKEFGTVTVFAFDKDQGLSEHTAPFDALVHIIDGKAQINVNKIEHIVKEGEMIIMPADKPHSLQAIEKFKMMLIMIKK